MRFVIAIVLFVVAAVSIGLGVAQRTILEGPDHLSESIDVAGAAPFTVVDGATLKAHPGAQLVEVTGTTSDSVFMAYARTDDVRAWLGGATAVSVSYDAKTGKLTSEPLKAQDGADVDSTETPAPTDTASAPTSDAPTDASTEAETEEGVSPAGSDLWIQEFEGDGTLVRKINVPSDVSVLIASDGTQAAPQAITITWPLDNSTPWSGPLIVAGIGALLLGLVALIWALVHARRRHGPRRKTPKAPKMPKTPKPAQLKPAPRRAAITAGPDTRGRRRAFIALPVLMVGALALSACTADGSMSTTPEPTDTASAVAEVDPPVVTKQQFTRIVSQTADVITQADAAGDATLAATRLEGSALAVREANYKVRAADSSVAAVTAFPTGEISLILPQQQHDWPRAVFAGIADADGNDFGVMFVQDSPRDQYKVHDIFRLTQSIPEVAPIELGASRYPTDSKLLAYPPAQLAAEYGDILINGANSQYAEAFDFDTDAVQDKVGAAYKEKRKADVPNAVLTYTSAVGTDPLIALATNDTGAIVTVELRETETVAPAEAGAAISPKGAVKALSQKQTTTKGIAAEYAMQLLFYVPPATASDQKVRVLGFAQGLVAASEVP